MSEAMERLREQLQDVGERHGGLTPDAVVEDAAAEDHPLHSRFEWDNDVAGPKYRREQARALIRSVRIKRVETDEGVDYSVRAFVSVERSPGDRVYETVEKVAADPILSAIAERSMRRQWRDLWARYQGFQAFRAMVEASMAEGTADDAAAAG